MPDSPEDEPPRAFWKLRPFHPYRGKAPEPARMKKDRAQRPRKKLPETKSHGGWPAAYPYLSQYFLPCGFQIFARVRMRRFDFQHGFEFVYHVPPPRLFPVESGQIVMRLYRTRLNGYCILVQRFRTVPVALRFKQDGIVAEDLVLFRIMFQRILKNSSAGP